METKKEFLEHAATQTRVADACTVIDAAMRLSFILMPDNEPEVTLVAIRTLFGQEATGEAIKAALLKEGLDNG